MPGPIDREMDHPAGEQSAEIGDFIIDFIRKEIYRGDERIPLAPKPFEVLEVLVRNAGRIISKADLLQRVWGQEFKDKNTVEQTIRQIRIALGDDAEHPRFIQTFPRQGYCFVLSLTPSTATPVKNASRFTKYSAYALAVLCIAAGIAAMLYIRARAREAIPVRVEFTTDSLRALDALGRPLWSRHFDGLMVPSGVGRNSLMDLNSLARVVDLRGDGQREVLAAVPIGARRDPNNTVRVELDCFSATGVLLWSYVPHERFRFGTNELSDRWTVLDLQISERARNTVIYADIAHVVWGNSFVVEIDPKTGRGTTRFVNTGTLHQVSELTTQGATYLVAAGFNNEFDGGSLALIDETKQFAASPQTVGTRHKCVSCPPGDPDFYFVFPRSELNRISRKYESFVPGVTVYEDRLEVSKVEADGDPDLPKTFYTLSPIPTFGTALLRFDSPYELRHKELERKGVLGHPLDNCPDRLNPAPVRVWTPGSGWRELKVKSTE